MSDENKVHVDLRTSFGKGFARRLRAEGKIPAVIYGHGSEPVHVALPGHQVSLIIRRANALLDLDIEGKSQLVLVKDVQRDPVRQIIEHLDLLVVKKGEKVQVDIPVVVTGEPFPGTVATLDLTTIKLEVAATHIPQHIEVSVEGLEEGAHISVGDVTLPEGASLLDDADLLLVAVSVPHLEIPQDEETDEGGEAGQPGKGEAVGDGETAAE